MTGSSPTRLLFCDFDGAFQFSDELTRIGFLVDQIRPEALRQVAVGDHDLFLFSFETSAALPKVLKTSEKLKYAELATPIALWARKPMGPEFLNHQTSEHHANLYIHAPVSISHLLDALSGLVVIPVPPHLKSSSFFLEGDVQSDKIVEEYRAQIVRLEQEMDRLRKQIHDSSSEGAGESLRPRLKALLEGQKLQFQTESEKIKVQLSEVEARLLDREARNHELELSLSQLQAKLSEALQSHEKAQKTMRAFYLQKLQAVEGEKKDLEKKISSQSS